MREVFEKIHLWQMIIAAVVIATGITLITGQYNVTVNGKSYGGNSMENSEWYNWENELCLDIGKEKEENGFQLYTVKDPSTLNIKGSYELIQGEEAEKYITEKMPGFGITKEELDDLKGRGSTAKALVFLVDQKSFRINGEDKTSENAGVKPRVAFYDEASKTLTFFPNENAPTEFFHFTPREEEMTKEAVEETQPEATVPEETRPEATVPEETTPAPTTQEQTEPTAVSPSSGGSCVLGDLTLTAPQGYELSSQTETSAAFFDENITGIFVYIVSPDTVDYMPKIHSSGEMKSIGPYTGYYYTDSGDHGFVFTHKGNGYQFEADDAGALESIVKTAK